ncbi:Rossmann fold domain-containing protein [Novosphingobium colocasiae]|uniref:Rossmann fold domain-containing protein n=1 Tax=Novosphingobium colocasiae TaxID=1256513 RepID=UPI0035AF9A31
MPTLRIDIGESPAEPLAAAAEFYTVDLPEVLDDCDIHSQHDVVIVFTPAPHEHRGWRLAAIQQLARDMAPRRVNALGSNDPDAIAAALVWLDRAAGVTGQVFDLDSAGAGSVV